jgi:5-methylcytosine-specific restriction endonuclease McrA
LAPGGGRRPDRAPETALKVVGGTFDVWGVNAPLAQATAPPPGLELTDFFSEVFAGVVGGLASSPWLVGVFALIALTRIVRAVRAVIHGRHRQDLQRRFSGEQRLEIFARAGHRCEQYSWLLGRCGATEDLQADHVHPHSRGGATVIENGQALCRQHNKHKSARVPWNWQLDRLARRRLAYFPASAPREVVRHRSTASLVAGG